MNNSKNGFTLLELMITITIAGILTSSASNKISDYVRGKRSEQYAIGLFSELCSYRALAIREDLPVIVWFSVNGGTNVNSPIAADHNVYINEAEDINIAGSSSRMINNGYLGEVGDLQLGIPTPAPTYYPASDTWADSESWSFLRGDWKKVVHPLTISADNPSGVPRYRHIIFENDEVGTISDGALYLKNDAVPSHGYAIIKAKNTNTLKLWKWDGSKWYKM